MSKIDLYRLLQIKEEKKKIIIMYENGESEYKISRKTKKPVIEIKIIIYKYKKIKKRKLKVPKRSLSKSDLEIIIRKKLINVLLMITNELVQELDNISKKLTNITIKLDIERSEQEQLYPIRKNFRRVNRYKSIREFLKMLYFYV